MKQEELKIGMLVKANEASNGKYKWTTKAFNCEGEVVRIEEGYFRLKVTSHDKNTIIGREYSCSPEYFEPAFEVGDIVEAIDNRYNYTCKEYKWVGVISHIDEDNTFTAQTISADYGSCVDESYDSLEFQHFTKRPDLMEFKEGDIVKLKSVSLFKGDIEGTSKIFGKEVCTKFYDTEHILQKSEQGLQDSWEVNSVDDDDNTLSIKVKGQNFWVNKEYFCKVEGVQEPEEIQKSEEDKMGISINLKEARGVMDFNVGDYLVLDNGDLLVVIFDYDGKDYRAVNLAKNVSTKFHVKIENVIEDIEDDFGKIIRVIPAENIEINEK